MNEKETKQLKDVELYLHIPFCVRKCEYCDFLSAPAKPEVQRAYKEALKQEIRCFKPQETYRVVTVFFGGGTPSLLPEEWIGELMETLRDKFSFAPDAEISIECNPGTADEKKLCAYRQAGINRLSIGLQSADNGELSLLGRMHTWEDFCRTYEAARGAGFSNINVDLMSALPMQTEETWERTLRSVLPYEPEHISAYSLIIEEGTPFYEKYASDDARRSRGERPQYLPEEEAERMMYERTKQLLAQAGMHRYEISNYAKDGYECRHNKGYWQGVPYIGFGLGASSLVDDAVLKKRVRYKKTDSLAAYLAGDFSQKDRQILTREEEMEEFMFLGLRLTKGVSAAQFERRFGKAVDEVYKDVLRRQQELGLLKKCGERIFLTPRGMDVSNTVMAEFLL